MAMAKVEIDLLENSLDSSGDNEILGLVGEGSYDNTDCERSQLVSQSLLDGNEEDITTTYTFKDIPGAVAYKLVQIPGEETPNNMSSRSPTQVLPSGEFYVIGNPVQVFGSSATQKKVIRRPPLEKTITKKRDDKRRATHNEVERRRRDKINSWIGKLAALIPTTGLPDTTSKGGILAKACEHISDLTEKQKKLEKLEVDNDKLVVELIRLNKEISELRNENTSLRLQLADNCIMTSHRPKGQRS